MTLLGIVILSRAMTIKSLLLVLRLIIYRIVYIFFNNINSMMNTIILSFIYFYNLKFYEKEPTIRNKIRILMLHLTMAMVFLLCSS
jgi:hypothetical protein